MSVVCAWFACFSPNECVLKIGANSSGSCHENNGKMNSSNAAACRTGCRNYGAQGVNFGSLVGESTWRESPWEVN